MADKPQTDQEKVPKWAWRGLVVFSVVVAISVWYFRNKTEYPNTFCSNEKKTTKQVKSIVVFLGIETSPPRIPYGYAYKIKPTGRIALLSPQIKEQIILGPGLPDADLGEIDLAKAKLTSLENGPVNVEFTYWPARPDNVKY